MIFYEKQIQYRIFKNPQDIGHSVAILKLIISTQYSIFIYYA